MSQNTSCKAGFVAVVGRPNAGKSSFLNWIVGEKLALVSHKANATRKRFNAIINHANTQLVFIDTPGIHKVERLLNEFMLEEALKAMSEADLVLFLSPVEDSLKYYKEFLELQNPNTPHIVVLSKIDTASTKQILQKLQEFEPYTDKFKELIPLSVQKGDSKSYLLDTLTKYIPKHPFYYDEDILTTHFLKEIYKEFIRESVFKYVHKEIPYFTDVKVDSVEEKKNLTKIYATIVVEKESYKPIIIGNGASNIKLIGKHARFLIERLTGHKIFLKLEVKIDKSWTKNKKSLENMGYM